MPYLCELEVSKQKRAIFLFFPSFEDKLRLKTLNLRFLTKKQVKFRGFYLLSHKLLIVSCHNMLHREIRTYELPDTDSTLMAAEPKVTYGRKEQQ